MQAFHNGDHVKIANDYSSGGSFDIKSGVAISITSEDAGKEAIVIASYNDKYGIPDTGGDYTLFFKGHGEVSWFPEEALTLIRANASDLLNQWMQELCDEINMKSDLDWIFSHGKEVIEHPYGSSVAELAKCFGLTNLWGKNGEGYDYYINSLGTMKMATPFLEAGDKTGWLEYCKKIRIIPATR